MVLPLIGPFVMLDSDCSSVRSFLLNVDDVDDIDEIDEHVDNDDTGDEDADDE
jgi:hypothetical protein